MDGDRFDSFVRQLGHGVTRRHLLRITGSGMLGMLISTVRPSEAEARSCRSAGSTCTSAATCCSGLCGEKDRTGRRRCECAPGQVTCGTTCLEASSLQTDPKNCGACGRTCKAPGGATSICVAGACTFTCKAGFHRCGDACLSDTNVNHCGASCTSCPVPSHAVATCDGVSCGFQCANGYHKCGDSCVSNNAVETCGSACTPCPAPVNGVATCTGGTCGFTCSSGYQACGSGCCPNGRSCCNGICCTNGESCNGGDGACGGAACLATNEGCDEGDDRCCGEDGEVCSASAGCAGSGEARCCRPQSSTCSSDCDCCLPNRCVAGICCPGAGSQCQTSGDCCSGLACVGNVCTQNCLPTDTPCSSNVQCCQDEPTFCSATANCTNSSTPQCCHPLNGSCSGDCDCCDGLSCNAGICGLCDYDLEQQCGSGCCPNFQSCCNDMCCAPTQFCDGQCTNCLPLQVKCDSLNNHCCQTEQTLCIEPGDPLAVNGWTDVCCRPVGGSCSAHRDCCTNSYDPASNVLAGPCGAGDICGGAGATCAADRMCVSGICEGICFDDDVQELRYCRSNSDCANEGYCAQSRCR